MKRIYYHLTAYDLKAKPLRLWLVINLFFICALSQAQNTGVSAYQVKAVFLYNFSQFVDWPPAAFRSADAPLIIGVTGNNPFGTYLEETIAGEKLEGHPMEAQYYKEVKDVRNCHILFINDVARIPEILASLKGQAILTVSDAEGFANAGGMIQFFIEKNKVRFKINTRVAKEAGITISSKLLRLAEIVK